MLEGKEPMTMLVSAGVTAAEAAARDDESDEKETLQ